MGVGGLRGEDMGEANTASEEAGVLGTSLRVSGHFSAAEWQTVVQLCSSSSSAPSEVLEIRHRA